ncbi:MAG TPA: dihydroxyacetone kinase subunit DhaK [Candidatus Corynebacterium avicola]|uniref:Dihydroxyacetone kinase subunit DhaK n=1 Tax=Candidatus Corynebacterium avicola TaxID=2838527 RepID=A0A9D1UK45_9CORY|nr:dihydroxyacetone kinase subunit DhaK [Candidatus Corynebacterium avicola]
MADSSLRSFRDTPDTFLPQSLGGFVASHPDARWDDHGFIARETPVVTESGGPAVAVISGGGSGHEPMHSGFLGEGMLAAAVPGHLFTSPNAVQVTQATRWANDAGGGQGVVHIVKNYTGDIINFRVARQGLPEVDTREVIVADDVATGGDADDSDGPGRRGTGATILVEKVAGAAAHRGYSLNEVTRVAQTVADNSRSMAAALAPGHLPTSGRDTFDLDEGEMEIGVGIHGEPGVERTSVSEASEVANRLVDGIVTDLGLTEGDTVVGLVNGLGGTTLLELNLVFDHVLRRLDDAGITVARSLVGSYVTSVNMAGVSVTFTRVSSGDAVDTEVLDLLDAPTSAPSWPRTLGVDPTPVDATMHVADDIPGGPEDETNEWLSAFVAGVVGAVDDLTELDRLAGDGDFGTNMQAAFGDLPQPVKGSDADVLAALANRLFVRAGGTSGAVFGTLFREMSVTAAAGTDAGLTAGELAEALQRALDAVTELGGAAPGDRTMVDALAPAATAAKDAVTGGGGDGASSDAAPDLAAIHAAALEGARSTAELAGHKGRASYLGDRTRGVIDPGALVVAWLFGGAGEMN